MSWVVERILDRGEVSVLSNRMPLGLFARIAAVVFFVAVSISADTVDADDWPQWRGQNRDAVIHERGLRKSLPSGVLPRRWTVPIGPGYSGPTVSNGLVYVTDRQVDDAKEQERILCFNADDGTLVWKLDYDVNYTIGYKAGPRASVTIHDGKALAVGAMGHLKCLDSKTGKLFWEHDLEQEYNVVEMPIWGITAAPLVHKDLVIQIAAGSGNACVVAFDLVTGEERWRSIDERAGYSAPVLIRQGEQDVVVCWTGESVTGLDPMTGEAFWNIPMLPRNMPIGVATPVVRDDLIFVSSFYDGSMLIRFDREQTTAKQVWHRVGIDETNTDALHCMISNPMIKGEYIYGVDSYGELRCLDLKSGDRVWEDTTAVPRARWATIHTIHDRDREIMLNDQGRLMFVTLSPDGLQVQSQTKLIAPTRQQLRRRGNKGVVWAHPAIANGNIYARSDEELICASLTESD